MSFLESLKSLALKVFSPASRGGSTGPGAGDEPGGTARAYRVTWITKQLAVGHAPTSYEELASIKGQGIDAIVNLCGEYCDLHRIEEEYGFEVLYLPVTDDDAPGMEEVERALAWLDEAIYLGKKVLVHCKLGIGRTGTFVRSYLLRRGFGPRRAEKQLGKIRSHPTSFNQWRFLRKYGKKEGMLTIREPSLVPPRAVDLDLFFTQYEALCRDADQTFAACSSTRHELGSCGRDTDSCCTQPFYLQLVEAITLNHQVNRELDRQMRLVVIDRARHMGRIVSGKNAGLPGIVLPVSTLLAREGTVPVEGVENVVEADGYRCPLSFEAQCILYSQRPLRCRTYGMGEPRGMPAQPRGIPWTTEAEDRKPPSPERLNTQLCDISRSLLLALNGSVPEGRSLLFSMPRVISGEFIQDYFTVLSTLSR